MVSKFLDTFPIERWGSVIHPLNMSELVTTLPIEYERNGTVISKVGAIDDTAGSLGHSCLEHQTGTLGPSC